MNSEHQVSSERTLRLRRELVAAVNATTRESGRFSPRVIVAAIGVFALAGAVTGGVVSTAALAAAPAEDISVNIETMAQSLVGTHDQLFGTPVVLSGSGESTIEFGTRPDGATSIAISLSCVDAGDFSISFNGVVDGTYACDRDAAESNQANSVGSGRLHAVDDDKPQTVIVESGNSSRYVVWASWAAGPSPVLASALQDGELEDGQVTRDEYVAAFDRFAACMSTADEPIMFVDKTGTVITYSTSNTAAMSGIDAQCYEVEFGVVDGIWQTANQDTSESTKFMRECLMDGGIAPAETRPEIVQQLKDADLFESCQ